MSAEKVTGRASYNLMKATSEQQAKGRHAATCLFLFFSVAFVGLSPKNLVIISSGDAPSAASGVYLIISMCQREEKRERERAAHSPVVVLQKCGGQYVFFWAEPCLFV